MPRHAALPAVPALRNPDFPAAPIRSTTDRAACAVAGFVAEHPEYGRLGAEVVEQVMATYRTDDEHATRGSMIDNGVPVGRANRWSDDA